MPSTWLDKHGAALYGYAMSRLRDAEAAEDLVQETLLAALQAHDRFRGQASVRTWLISILRHKLLDQLRRKYRRGPELSFDPYDGRSPFDEERYYIHALAPRAWSDPHTAAEHAEFRAALAECLGKLPERARSLFILRELEGETAPAICKNLNITATNFHTLMHRTRAALRRCMGKKVSDE